MREIAEKEYANMRMKLNVNRTVSTVLTYCIVFLVIMGNYSMLERDLVYGVSETAMAGLASFLCFVMAVLQLNNEKKRVLRRDTYTLAVVGIVTAASIIIPGINMSSALWKWLVPIVMFSCFFATGRDTPKIWVVFSNLMIVMATVSLLLYIFGTVLKIIPPSRVAYYTYFDAIRACNTYFGLQYEAQLVQGAGILAPYRNCGFFIEAPMFNVLLCLAFAAECSFTSRPRKWVLIILALTIISTFTTTGIMFLAIMIAVRILAVDKSAQMKMLTILIAPLVIFLLIFAILTALEMKLQTASGSDSFTIRVDHLIAFLKMWMERPLFGGGFGNVQDFYKYARYDQGFSVGLPSLLGRSGIFMFALYLVPWFQRTKYSFKYKKKELYFWVGSIFCLFMTAITYKTIMVLIFTAQLFWKCEDDYQSIKQTDNGTK